MHAGNGDSKQRGAVAARGCGEEVARAAFPNHATVRAEAVEQHEPPNGSSAGAMLSYSQLTLFCSHFLYVIPEIVRTICNIST